MTITKEQDKELRRAAVDALKLMIKKMQEFVERKIVKGQRILSERITEDVTPSEKDVLLHLKT